MNYLKFENTLDALHQCYEDWSDDVSESEQNFRKKLVELMKQILEKESRIMNVVNYIGFDFHTSSAIAKLEIIANRFDATVLVYYTSNPTKGYSYLASFKTIEEINNFIDLYNQYDGLSISRFINQLIKRNILKKEEI
jgi:vacuolar-type H+-ATPase catalytic subunit A/Vma1